MTKNDPYDIALVARNVAANQDGHIPMERICTYCAGDHDVCQGRHGSWLRRLIGWR
jgi:hypothetical protein